jgi:hypothetical protein
VIILGILVGAAAGLILFVGANLVPLVDQMCSLKFDSDIKLVNEMAQKFIQFENNVSNWTSTYMCTQTCPCPPTVTPSLWTEAKLNKY